VRLGSEVEEILGRVDEERREMRDFLLYFD